MFDGREVSEWKHLLYERLSPEAAAEGLRELEHECSQPQQFKGEDSRSSTLRSLFHPHRNTLRAKGTLISEPRFSTPCEMRFFPREKGKTALVEGFYSKKAVFPFSRGKNRISQGVENRGSLISVPLALRAITSKNKLKSQDVDFPSVELRKRKRKKISDILFLFVSVACCIFIRKCGLLLWLVRAQHGHYKSKCKRKSGGIFCLSITKAKAKSNLQIFICNHFRADGCAKTF